MFSTKIPVRTLRSESPFARLDRNLFAVVTVNRFKHSIDHPIGLGVRSTGTLKTGELIPCPFSINNHKENSK